MGETKSYLLINCLKKFINERKDEKFRCDKEDSFLIKDIYEEIFKRIVNPVYIIILSLLSSLLILKSKVNKFRNSFKYFIFFIGFLVIIFSELSYKFLSYTLEIEILFLLLPIIFVFIFYLNILLITKFKPRYL